VVFPEAALQGYLDLAVARDSDAGREQLDALRAGAEPIPGPSTECLVELARKTGLVIQLGLAEVDARTKDLFNSIAVVDSRGVCGVYRKLHNEFERPYFASGDDLTPIATEAGLLGPMICYDAVFPEVARSYAVSGVDVFTVSTAWPMEGHNRAADYYGKMMDLCCESNAFFNQIPLVCSNHCEADVYSQGLDYYGRSQIVDATGRVIAVSEGDVEGVITHEITTGDSEEKFAFFGHDLLADRRPECYQPGRVSV
jgi:predicted amidohydrolase